MKISMEKEFKIWFENYMGRLPNNKKIRDLHREGHKLRCKLKDINLNLEEEQKIWSTYLLASHLWENFNEKLKEKLR